MSVNIDGLSAALFELPPDFHLSLIGCNSSWNAKIHPTWDHGAAKIPIFHGFASTPAGAVRIAVSKTRCGSPSSQSEAKMTAMEAKHPIVEPREQELEGPRPDTDNYRGGVPGKIVQVLPRERELELLRLMIDCLEEMGARGRRDTLAYLNSAFRPPPS